MAAPSTSQGTKRKLEDTIVDPDTLRPIEDAKKPKIDLSPDKKFNCLKSIVEMYGKVLILAFATQTPSLPGKMEVDSAPTATLEEAKKSITVGNHITSIIFTVHNICRQGTKRLDTNMIKKTERTSYKIHFKGVDYLIANESIKKAWEEILAKNNLVYKDYEPVDPENWYGTMGPYLDMFSAFALRVNELRLGHNNMPITKQDGIHKSFPVAKYGLSGAHHVLLEGASFPPERRSSIVQSLGPMTAWLCMLRSEGIYRKKYAAAVKRAMSHIPCIDEMIELTKNTKQASEIAALTTLVAEIILVTTSRQATRMFFPLTIFSDVWNMQRDHKKFCEFFSTTGAGGWYTYKLASTLGNNYTISGDMQEEMASQIVYHGIFGTYKEDLSILAQITNIGTWFTREEMGGCFRQAGTKGKTTRVKLPVMRVYAKMSCANQTGLLSGVYNQVVTVPCFSGQRIHLFDATFFEHMEKKRAISNSGKTMGQIVNILTSTLEELHNQLKKDNGKISMGTTNWRSMESLELGVPGEEISYPVEGRNKMFLGKN